MADRDKDESLKRETAGRYRSADGRFTVEAEGANAWYVADEEQVDQLGQPVLRGPFSTLAAARSAVVEARRTAVAGRELPKRRGQPRAEASSGGAKAKVVPDRPAAREGRSSRAADRDAGLPAWLTDLEPRERAAAQRLVDELRGLGLEEPEALVTNDLRSDEPLVAEALLARRIRERLRSEEDSEAVLDILRGEGFRPGSGRPPFGWRVVELDRQGKPTERRLRLRRP
jgi:hypothetical protein